MKYLFFLVVLSLVVHAAKAVAVAVPPPRKRQLATMLSSLFLVMPEVLGMCDAEEEEDTTDEESSANNRLPPRKRVRRHVQSIFDEHGSYYQRRAYRMPAEDFWYLLELIKPFMKCGKLQNTNPKKRNKQNSSVNGVIPCSIRLSCALQYFAGGAVYDIAIAHGVSNTRAESSSARFNQLR